MSDFWTDWSQNNRIRETEEQIAAVSRAHARSRSRLAEQMRDQHGNLQAQIDRLTTAFVAMVEYEDIRGELNEYADAAAIRRFSRSVIAATMAGGFGLSTIPVPADATDYWLHPATRGLASATKGSMAEVRPQLELAAQRDPNRTALFLTLIDAITREPRWSGDHLDRVLPHDAEVTYVQRCLWVAVTDDRLGEDAYPALGAGLRSALTGVDVPAAITAWLDASDCGRGASRLSWLRRTVDGAAGEPSAEGPATPAPAADQQETPEDPLATVLISLVDEGAPGETEIITRMNRARAEMGFVSAERNRWVWDRPEGSAIDLLLQDLGDPAASPALRRLALRLLGPSLTTVAEQLRTEIGQQPPSERIVDLELGVSVPVTATGAATDGWRQEFESAAARAYPMPAAWAGWAFVALGLIGLALGAVQPGFALLGVAAVVGVVLLLQNRRRRADIRERRELAETRAERTIAQTATEIATTRSRYDDAQPRAEADLAAIRSRLTDAATESSPPE